MAAAGSGMSESIHTSFSTFSHGLPVGCRVRLHLKKSTTWWWRLRSPRKRSQQRSKKCLQHRRPQPAVHCHALPHGSCSMLPAGTVEIRFPCSGRGQDGLAMHLQLPADSEEETQQNTIVQAQVKSRSPAHADSVQTQFAGKFAFAIQSDTDSRFRPTSLPA